MTYHVNNLNLLVVEDNLGDFLLIEDYIKEENPSTIIEHVDTFSKAKKKLRENSSFDIILLDLSLPDANGEILVAGIVDIAQSIPVIVLTGYDNKEFGIGTLSLGVSDYLVKGDLTSTQLYKSITFTLERQRINYKLTISEENYRSLFSLSPIPMYLVHSKTLKFLKVNEAAVQNYGYSEEEFLSMSLYDIRPTDEYERLFKEVKSAIDGRSENGNFIHRRKNNELINVDIRTNLVEFDGMQALVVIAMDITARQAYIKQIEEQNQKMVEIAWMQSHVVRAPLARIMGLVKILTREGGPEINKEEILSYLNLSAHELDDVIREIVRRTEESEVKAAESE